MILDELVDDSRNIFYDFSSRTIYIKTDSESIRSFDSIVLIADDEVYCKRYRKDDT